MKKIKFAILGCGMIGDVHAVAISELSELCELWAICDANPSRASEYGKKYNARVYSDYEQMLREPEIDAVIVCTPSGMHADQSIAALEAGKHVLCEKPMALNSRDAQRVCDAEKKAGKLVGVVFQTRYVKDIRELRRAIEDGLLGQLVFCDLYMKYWRDPAYFEVSPWRGTFLMDGGGALMNQGIHGVDIMHYLCGTPRLLGAKVKTLVHDIETEDTAVAAVEYPSGALGVMQASTSANPGFDRRIEIHGSRGYATVVNATLEKLYVDGNFLVNRKVDFTPGTASDPTKMNHENHTLQIKNFVLAIQGEEALLSTTQDGLAAVSFIEQIYKASKKT